MHIVAPILISFSVLIIIQIQKSTIVQIISYEKKVKRRKNMDTQQLTTLVGGISGICWTIVYIALVYRSFRDKSYGMPIAALAMT